MTKKADALLKIPSEVPSGKDVPFQDITVMSFAEAQALDDIKLGEHVLALGNEFVKRAGSAVKFVMLHRSAIQERRKRYSQQGRRNPVPGSPSWGEFCTNVFHVSQQYMNSILASAYPKKLVAKKKTKKPSIPAATVTDITTDSDPRPEAEAMNETAAQAVAVVAAKLARMVADGHGGSKDAKAFAKEIVEVNEDEPFLPTEVNTTANLSVIQRLWEKLFKDGSYTMPEAAKKGVITRFVNSLSNEDYVMVGDAIFARLDREEKSVKTDCGGENVTKVAAITAAGKKGREEGRADVERVIQNAPVSDEVKAAALAEAAEMLQAHYPKVAAGTPPAKPPESGLEPMAHAGEVATILIDLMERGGKPTYSYAELQRAFRDADTGFRHRSFVQATKLLKERGYYPTGNVLVYNPHPASQPSEGAKEQSAGA